MTDEDQYELIDEFHEHLDRCDQCRNHPFDLCKEGESLLKKAAGQDVSGTNTNIGPEYE